MCETAVEVYIQQYGKERTGTNYLKGLLAINFSNITLFDNRLGSKHQPHQDISRWLAENNISDQNTFDRYASANGYWIKRNLPTFQSFEQIHKPVKYADIIALKDGTKELRYLISIKDPFAFAVSINRWKTRKMRGYRFPPSVKHLDPAIIVEQCKEFNKIYRSYLPLLGTEQTILVRYEELLKQPTAVLTRLGKQWGLSSKQNTIEVISTTVAPSVGISHSPFYRWFYETRQYLSLMNPSDYRMIRDSIDWDLMSHYGYAVD